MDTPIFMIAVGAGLAILCLALALGGGERRKMLTRRAASLRQRDPRNAVTNESANSVKRDEHSVLPTVDRWARRSLPKVSVLRECLARTGRNITVGGYVFANLLVAALGTLAAAGGGIKGPAAILVGIAIGVAVPHWAIKRLATKRAARFLAAFPEAIDLIVRGLKSGLPIGECIAAVGRELPDPVGLEFRLIADNVRFGRTIEDALWETAGRVDLPEIRFFVISLAVQRETGGNLAETLGNLSDILRRRRQMRLKIRAMSSEARASAYILGSLPFVMFGIIMLINTEYEMLLFRDPRGLMMVTAGMTSLGLGILTMAKLVRFEI